MKILILAILQGLLSLTDLALSAAIISWGYDMFAVPVLQVKHLEFSQAFGLATAVYGCALAARLARMPRPGKDS